MPLAPWLPVMAVLLGQQAALDFEFFRARVQPIFLSKREGHARCYVCHSRGTGFRLQPLSPGSASWNEVESRRNFEAAQRLVVPGEPLASRLLTMALAEEAGGNPFHPGGKFFESQSDTDWLTLAAWVRTVTPVADAPSSPPAATQSLDFEFYRKRVEPIFLKLREGSAPCFACHSTIASRFRLERLSAGAASWSEEQSRHNFEAAVRLVTPGEPLGSRLLLHALAVEAGGDPIHTGGKFWQSRDDPEWQTLAAWVNTGSPTASASSAATTPALDFDFFKARVEPIFLHKRPGRARCYVCHSRGTTPFRLQPLSPGTTSWSEEQSRRNFDAAGRLVAPGDPLASRLLTIALAEEAGGDPFHPGGKHWQSRDDTEWQLLAEWVRGHR